MYLFYFYFFVSNYTYCSNVLIKLECKNTREHYVTKILPMFCPRNTFLRRSSLISPFFINYITNKEKNPYCSNVLIKLNNKN